MHSVLFRAQRSESAEHAEPSFASSEAAPCLPLLPVCHGYFLCVGDTPSEMAVTVALIGPPLALEGAPLDSLGLVRTRTFLPKLKNTTRLTVAGAWLQ